MSAAGLLLAVMALALGVPSGDRSPLQVIGESLLTPLLLLSGPGFLIALGMIAVIGWSGRHGFGRGFAVIAAGAAGLLWLGVFLSPQLFSDPPRIPNPGVLITVIPWLAYGLVARLARRPSPRDIYQR